MRAYAKDGNKHRQTPLALITSWLVEESAPVPRKTQTQVGVSQDHTGYEAQYQERTALGKHSLCVCLTCKHRGVFSFINTPVISGDIVCLSVDQECVDRTDVRTKTRHTPFVQKTAFFHNAEGSE